MNRISTFTLLISIFLCGILNAQEFQGKAIYESKTSFNRELPADMPQERREEIMKRINSALINTYTLNFNQSESTFQVNPKLDATENTTSGPGARMMVIGGGGANNILYKNIQDKNSIEQTESLGKFFLIESPLELEKWQLSGETKKIGHYTCYKAIAIQELDTNSIQSVMRKMRPDRPQKEVNPNKEGKLEKANKNQSQDSTTSRRGEGGFFMSTDEPKERTITAWFTPEIPVSHGPSFYWGLPGLILEVSDGRTTMLCSEIQLNPEDKVQIKQPSKGKEIGREEYNELIAERMKAMRDNFRAGNHRGDGPRPR